MHRSARALLCAAVVLHGAACSGGSADETRSSPVSVSGSAAPSTDSVATAAPGAEPTIERMTIAAPSLAGNLVGDPAEIDVAVQLPATYVTSDVRYPVVYFLHGYDETVAVAPIGGALDELVDAGAAPEMIVVAISGRNAFGGSFYVDSPVTGHWAEAIHHDVVDAIDGMYRTIPSPGSRGIAGFSMGGFGALDLAMRHPDVFGAVYALSPGLFDPSGLADSQMFADPDTVAQFIAGRDELLAMEPVEAADELARVMGRSGDVRFSLAYGMAFAPDPAAPPYVDYPFDSSSGPADEAIWARWESGYGGIDDEVARFADELRSLRGVLVDWGVRDEYTWIPRGCEYFGRELGAHDIPVELEQFDGGHGPISLRAAEVMWPFFAEVLTH
jgi:S-formylglutathione hydrolase FrmB